MNKGRLLLSSPFAEAIRCPTSERCGKPNDYVVGLVGQVVLAYADHSHRTQATAKMALNWSGSVFTFDSKQDVMLLYCIILLVK